MTACINWWYRPIYNEIMAPGFDINKASCVMCTITVLNEIGMRKLAEHVNPELYDFSPAQCISCIYNESRKNISNPPDLEQKAIVLKYRSYAFVSDKDSNNSAPAARIDDLQPTDDLDPYNHMIIYQGGVWYEVPEGLRKQFLAEICRVWGIAAPLKVGWQ
jgi:hypothetical protein